MVGGEGGMAGSGSVCVMHLSLHFAVLVASVKSCGELKSVLMKRAWKSMMMKSKVGWSIL